MARVHVYSSFQVAFVGFEFALDAYGAPNFCDRRIFQVNGLVLVHMPEVSIKAPDSLILCVTVGEITSSKGSGFASFVISLTGLSLVVDPPFKWTNLEFLTPMQIFCVDMEFSLYIHVTMVVMHRICVFFLAYLVGWRLSLVCAKLDGVWICGLHLF